MKLRVIVTLVAALALGVGSASAQSIGLYFDSNGATCSTVQPSGTQGTFYIMAVLGGGASAGITGAEFRVDGFPSGWFPNPTPKPGGTSLGSPIPVGCNIAFNCDLGTNGLVLLYTVPYFANSTVSDARMSVMQHTSPSNPNFLCPLVTLCDAPAFSKLCVSGGQAYFNPVGHGCTVAVEQKTWSEVKSLYTN